MIQVQAINEISLTKWTNFEEVINWGKENKYDIYKGKEGVILTKGNIIYKYTIIYNTEDLS